MQTLRVLLLPFSLIYFLILQLIYLLYRIKILKKFRPACKVISVGNITVGGTGKTPLAELIAGHLRDRGKKVAVLIRGYGRDESLLLKRKLEGIEVLVGRDRIKNSIKAAKDFRAEVIILDDGFQHWRIERDLDIVVIDSMRPFSDGLILPAGMLREPLSQLRRSDVFFLTRIDQTNQDILKNTMGRLKAINPGALVVESMHRPLFFYKMSNPKERISLDGLMGKEVVLISGIGNPYSFKNTVESLGTRVKGHFRFSDHFWYREKDLLKIFDFCRDKEILNIITTEKDAVKLTGRWKLEAGSWKPEIFVLAIKIEILKNEERLLDRLNRVCSS